MRIINIAIEPVEGPAIPCGFIDTQEGKITAIGPMEALPAKEDSQILDGTGLTAYPGFVDGHSHLGMFGDGLGFEGDDGNEDTDPTTPQLRAIDAVNPLDRGFTEALDYGVTTVVTGPGSANAIGGQMCAVKTWGRQVDRMLVKAPAAMKFAFGENPKVTYNGKAQSPSTRMATAALIREQLQKALRYQQDLNLALEDEERDEPEFDAKCEALLPVLSRELKVHIHAHRADDICTAIRICKEFQLDYVLVHTTEGHLVADILAEEQAEVIVGPVICHRSKPELVGATLANAAILEQNGLHPAICTDHPEIPQEYLAMSAGLCMTEGLSRQAALEGITLRPAMQCGIADRLGSLVVGKDADILLFDRDPLGLRIRPRYVIVNGTVVRSPQARG